MDTSHLLHNFSQFYWTRELKKGFIHGTELKISEDQFTLMPFFIGCDFSPTSCHPLGKGGLTML